MRLYKCYGSCNKKYPLDQMEKYSGKNHCLTCHNIKLRDAKDREDLYQYLSNMFNIEYPTGLMLKQIKEFKDELGYSYGGIKYTLWYMTEIENKSFSDIKYGIALIKYYYEKAKDYFEQQQRISNSMVNVNSIETRTVKINLNNVKRKREDKFTFDIDDLIGGD